MRNSFHSWAAAVALAAAAGWSTSALAQVDIPDVAGDAGGAVQEAVEQAPEVPQQVPEVPTQPQREAPQPQVPETPAPRADDIPQVDTEDLTDGAIQQGDRTIEDTQEAIDDTADRAQEALDDTTDRARETVDDATDRVEDTADDATDLARDTADETLEDADAAMQEFGQLDEEAQARVRADAEFNDEINQEVSSDIGLEFGDDADAEGEAGLTVSNVAESSLAAQAGLRRGDRIVSVDGRNFNSYRGFNEYVWRNGYTRLPIVVIRGGQRQTIWWDAYPNRWNNHFHSHYYGHRDRYYDGGFAQQGPHAGLGVLVVDSGLPQGGVFVQAVYENSPAAQAGVRPGDVILAMNGRGYRSATQFVQAIRQMDLNSRVRLAILREDGQETQLTAQLSTRDRALGGEHTQEQLAERERGERETVLRPQYEDDGQQSSQASDAAQQRIEELEQQVRDLRQQIEEMNNQNQ